MCISVVYMYIYISIYMGLYVSILSVYMYMCISLYLYLLSTPLPPYLSPTYIYHIYIYIYIHISAFLISELFQDFTPGNNFVLLESCANNSINHNLEVFMEIIRLWMF